MTLEEIVTACREAYGARFQVNQATILQYINTIQQVAFNRDLHAFLWHEDYVTVYQQLELEESGYTSCVAADVGLPVVGGTSGSTGTLRYYNNTTRKWLVETDDTFTELEAITLTAGTGGGVLTEQTVGKGPYSWSALAPTMGSLTPFTNPAGVRKMLGVSRITDLQVFQPESFPLLLDYGFASDRFNGRALYEAVRKYDMQKFLSFVNEPETDADYYRWIYFIRPPKIDSILAAADVNLLIPPELHQITVVEGVGILADRATYGDQVPEDRLRPCLEPFWETVMQSYTPMGDGSNGTSDGQL